MRVSVGQCLVLFAFVPLGVNCSFSPHPASGVQACSSGIPPQCPAGYSCVTGRCYENAHLPATGGAAGDNASGGAGGAGNTGGADGGGVGGADGSTCTPSAIVCGTGSGKRCGRVTDQCSGTVVECGGCIAGESCGNGHLCAVSCGQIAQPCCTGSTCTAADSVCSDGSCVACGAANQICCANDACSAAGTTCSESSTANAGKDCLLACAVSTGACISGTDVDCALACGPGPSRSGVNTCTCTSNAWKCLGCSFPTGVDYSCFKLPAPPATAPACDATTPPTIGGICTAAPCSACGSATGKGYVDALGIARSGYCVCTNGRWSCALVKEWPCPGSQGC